MNISLPFIKYFLTNEWILGNDLIGFIYDMS